ncbi:Lytic enzyme（phage related &|uniref:glycoside hydrolase family 19 protein n=1 Tax=Magnetospirillum sp. XM-1 TaxID=1663591 RepID=UPI00073DF74D|nr:glycoside hydrolase family 19 protein [Magnetospirillum sp. XM-1]CUW37136.1 Lytic enzyme\
MLTREILRASMPGASSVDLDHFLDPLAQACTEWGIETPIRLAAFLAQIAHESDDLACRVENLNYSAEALLRVFPRHFDADQAVVYAHQPERIGSRVYGNRMGNGDEASGDGWRYRGRGLIQLTGRANYTAACLALGADLIGQPELLEQPGLAARSAGWFWRRNNLNAFADRGDVISITRHINGGLIGIEDRKHRYAQVCAALGITLTEA